MSSPSAISSSRSSNGNTAEGYIRRYAAPIWDYLIAPDVIEIAVNPDETVWVERIGASHMTKTEATITANAIRQLTNQIAGSQGIKSGRNNLINQQTAFWHLRLEERFTRSTEASQCLVVSDQILPQH